MRLNLPKIKKKNVSLSSLNARRIAKTFMKGIIAMREKQMKADTEKARQIGIDQLMGLPFPLSQALSIQLQGKGGVITGDQAAADAAKKGEVKEFDYKGIALPHGMTHLKGISFGLPMETRELRDVNIKYPLVPQNPKKGEFVYAYAHIAWDESVGSLVYNVVEPRLSAQDKEATEKIKREIEERLDVNFSKLGAIKAKELLRKEIQKSISEMPSVDPSKISIIQYHIEKDIIGLGLITPLMHDPEIEDISCDGEKIPIYIYHRNPKFGSMRTNVWFESKTDLDEYVLKLAQKSGKSISIAEPLLDAALPDGSRVQCTMGTDIARRGSNFTIRKFTFYPLTPTHMQDYGTLNSLQLAYMWLAIEHGKSILISGGTATGKTSLLNALSLFIKPDLKILSIEDTPELRLPHTHWVPEVARSPLSVKGKIGEVTLFDLLKSSLRQRPDYLVVGEVRGKEAFVMFQQIATGHPSISTIHAASFPQLVDRLVTPPISLPPALIENVDIIIFLARVRVRGRERRRAVEIREVVGIKDDRPYAVKVFEWVPIKDDFVPKDDSKVLEDIARMGGMNHESVQMELLRRKRILEWLKDTRVYDYQEFSRVISDYYTNPERVTNLVEEPMEE
ncbi:MAG: type II/IV secretion system ATPase subunit [Candidatus Aenigmarchaeota archaeon]|nr:type II/IV secretion system ATPase subunit [Candidatus Aenigmarchaeota archaeon]